MKTSEQMTADVLKRRDEELKALPKKRRIKMAAIGLPCTAAAAAVGIVSFNFVHGANEFLRSYEGVTMADYTYAFFHNSRGRYIHSLSAPGSSGDTEPGNFVLDGESHEINNEDNIQYVLKYVYHIAAMEDISTVMASEKPAPDIEPTDFIEQTVKLMNMHYGIEFDRFTRLHPDWTETHEQFGYYVHDEYTSEYASRQFLSDQNTLNYVTPDGAEISVTAQRYQKFFDDKMTPAWDGTDGDGIIGEIPNIDPPEYPTMDGGFIEDADGNITEISNAGNRPDVESHNIYDEDGNIIGAFTPGYDPGYTGVINDNRTDVVKTIVYHSFEGTEWLTYLDMGNTCVRIHIKGILSNAEVIDLLEEYTANPADVSGETANEPENSDDQSWLNEINSLNNPYYGKYSFKFISGESGLLSSINCVEGYPADYELSKPEYTFWDRGIDYLSQHYQFDFDRLGRLHPDWSKTIDRPLGIYSREESPDVDSFTIVSDYNTLGYTTPDGAKILVTAQKKPFYPAGEILEDIEIGKGPFIVLDEDGNKIDELKFFNPHFSVDIPEDAENVEVEIYSDRSDPDTHLVYINMGSWVKIRAEGFSDKEFLDLIKEFIK